MTWNVFFRTGALGDFIVSLPLLRQLAAPVCLIAHRRHFELLDEPVDAFIDCNSAEAGRLFEPGNGPWPGRLHEEILPGARFYAFQKRDRELAASLARRGCRDIAWLDPRPTRPPHIAQQFADAAGVARPRFGRPLWKRELAGDALWIHPGSGSPSKNVSTALLVAVAQAWGGAVVVSFGEADEVARQAMPTALAQAGVPFEIVEGVSISRLREELCRRASCYLGNDSGVSHLATGCGIRSAILFKSSDSRIWLPLGPSHAFTEADRPGDIARWLSLPRN